MEINKIYLGDCLEIMKDISDGGVDMILCDLPYGTTACKWDSIIPFEPLWKQYNRVIKDNGAIVLFGCEPFSSYLRTSNIQQYRYDWKWDKVVSGNPLNANKMPLKIYEDIMVFYKKLPTYNPQMTLRDESKMRPATRKSINSTTNTICLGKSTKDRKYKYPTNKIEINGFSNELNSRYRIHPTQKPVALLEYLIKTYTNEGETILDNTIGSGSTGEACIKTKRNFIGIEQDDKYFEIANNRIQNCLEQLNKTS